MVKHIKAAVAAARGGEGNITADELTIIQMAEEKWNTHCAWCGGHGK